MSVRTGAVGQLLRTSAVLMRMCSCHWEICVRGTRGTVFASPKGSMPPATWVHLVVAPLPLPSMPLWLMLGQL